MRSLSFVALAACIILLFVAAGCSQPAVQPQPTVAPVVQTPVATELPTTVATAIPTTKTPVPTTIVPAAPLPVTIKDTKLLYTIFAPDGFAGRTIRVTKSTGYSIIYKTVIYNPAVARVDDIVNDNSGNYRQLDDSLTIFFYSATLSQDQEVKNLIRDKGVANIETIVSYNGIKYNRFEIESDPFSGKPGKTVVFIGSKGDANENGYLPEMIYTVTGTGKLSEATFEDMVKSFRFYPARRIDSAPGTETDRPTYYQ